MLGRIDDQFQLLSINPLAGRARPELGTALRSIPVGSYVIFYRADDEAVDVVRVRSGYLDVDPDDFT